MNESKHELYRKLVNERKNCSLCYPKLENASKIKGETDGHAGQYDVDEIGAWCQWQDSLDAKILLVGQDWADKNTFTKCRGKEENSNPTNRNLIKLFSSIGISISGPEDGVKDKRLFFTNIVLCMKNGSMSSEVNSDYCQKCGNKFLKPLIDIINPKVIIALGGKAYKAITHIYGIKNLPLKEAVENKNTVTIGPNAKLFPVYHCGSYGININRKFDKQLDDWKKIVDYL